VTSLLLTDGGAASAADDDATSVLVGSLLGALDPELVGIRRHIHAHPELSGREVKTTSLVARRLRAAGLRPRLLPGQRNGLMCDIGRGDRVIALRADLDAWMKDQGDEGLKTERALPDPRPKK